MTEIRPTQNLGSALAFATDRVATPVEGMHRTIAGSWLGPLGALGEPIRKINDTVTAVAYGSVRFGAEAAGHGLDDLLTVDRGAVDSLQAFVNGLWGDELGRHEDRLKITMAIRDAGGAPVAIGPDLAASFPSATGRLIVLLHGLVETERCWSGTETAPGLAEALDHDSGLTPVSIRYNSGLRVSDNGALLSSLLEETRANWPVPVTSIALVGHSMGGLVVRSACETARFAGHKWIADVDTIVTVAAPHRGSPLEKLANVAAWGLGVASVTRPLARFVNGRSVGIKDLRFGAIVECDWIGVDPDALLRNTVDEQPLPAGIEHHFVAGAITSDPSHPVGMAVGDLVVRSASGTGGRHLKPESAVVVGGKHHFDLLGDPEVISDVMDWLAPATPDSRSQGRG